MPDDTRTLPIDDLIELVSLRASPVGDIAPSPVRPRPWRLLLLLALLPALLTCVYSVFLAAPRYVSEARFSVTKPNAGLRLASSSLTPDGALPAMGSEDSYAVHDFLESRDAMRLLLDKAGLREMLTRAGRDPLWAFPGIGGEGSDEELFRYLRRLISVEFNSTTGITTVEVQAFRPEDAQRIANVLLDGSEALVNRLNARAQADAIRVAEAEVARAKAESLAAEDQLTAFRNRWSVIDPTVMSQTVLAAISTLTLQVVEASAQLDVLVHSQPRSPQIAPINAKLNALRAQIEQERGRLAGSDASFAPRVAEYETLVLKRDFAAKSFVSALTVLEMVRLDAERQQAYVSRIVTPRVADEYAAPRPVLWTLIALFAGLAVFWAFRPQEHR